jgi:ferredoxin
MKSDLLKRGYPYQLIDRGIEKATSLSIETLRTPKPVTEVNPCAFVYTHNPRNRNMWTTVQNSLDILNSDPRCSRMLDSFVLINSRRQPPNLKKLLTKAKCDTSTSTVTQCQNKRCGTCPYIITGEHFTFKNSQKPFRVKVSMNCATENLLYVLQCQGCLENYIGQTSDSLRARIRVHKQQINTPEYRKIPVSKHIAECARDHSIPFKVFPFYKLFQSDKTLRDVKEQSFIHTFKPLLNSLAY